MRLGCTACTSCTLERLNYPCPVAGAILGPTRDRTVTKKQKQRMVRQRRICDAQDEAALAAATREADVGGPLRPPQLHGSLTAADSAATDSDSDSSSGSGASSGSSSRELPAGDLGSSDNSSRLPAGDIGSSGGDGVDEAAADDGLDDMVADVANDGDGSRGVGARSGVDLSHSQSTSARWARKEATRPKKPGGSERLLKSDSLLKSDRPLKLKTKRGANRQKQRKRHTGITEL